MLPLEIAIATDSNYIVPTTVLLESIFENNKNLSLTINLLYLESRTKAEDMLFLKEYVLKNRQQCRTISVNEDYIEGFPQCRHSKSTYLRLFLPNVLPKDVKQILYLDGDIVVQNSLSEFCLFNIDDAYVAAAIDTANFHGRDYINKLGLPLSYQYFNAGVLYINLEKWREDNIFYKFIDFIKNKGEILIDNDQGTLNAVLHRAVKYFSPIYNFNFWAERDVASYLFTKEDVDQVWKNPTIIHYIGPIKPWNYKSFHPKKDVWWHYLERTPFKDYKPKDKNLIAAIQYPILWTIAHMKRQLTIKQKQNMGKIIPNVLKKILKQKLYRLQ